jgi:hypothetical protein
MEFAEGKSGAGTCGLLQPAPENFRLLALRRRQKFI